MDMFVPIVLAILLMGSVTVVAWVLSKRELHLIVKFIPIFMMEFVAIGFIYYGLVVQEDVGHPYSILGISMILLAFFPLQIIIRAHLKNTSRKGRDLK